MAVDQIAYHPRNRTAGEPLRILIAGTIPEKKGILDALRAIGDLNRDIEVEVTVLGRTTDGPCLSPSSWLRTGSASWYVLHGLRPPNAMSSGGASMVLGPFASTTMVALFETHQSKTSDAATKPEIQKT
ncbi:hypothetical protein ACTRXD_13360 [Nitrospira sp. T9]|uniref:hypothetical protein n=1 Tax=unclassified Nitrospira TaxID=2652172 RepID=UPI003F9B90B9